MRETDAEGVEWLVCTCAHGCGDTQPTTSPENCEYENTDADEYHALDAIRAQWKPNRATMEIEMIRRKRVSKIQALPPLRPLTHHPDYQPVDRLARKPIGHNAICARIDEAALVKKYGPRRRNEFSDKWDALRRADYPSEDVWALIDAEESTYPPIDPTPRGSDE